VQGARTLHEELDAAAGADGEHFADEELAALCTTNPPAQSGGAPQLDEDVDDERRMQQKLKNQQQRRERKRVRFVEEVEFMTFKSEDRDAGGELFPDEEVDTPPPAKRDRTVEYATTHSPEPMWSKKRPLPESSPLCGGTAESGDKVTPPCAGSPELSTVTNGSFADDETSEDETSEDESTPECDYDATNPGASVTPPPEHS